MPIVEKVNRSESDLQKRVIQFHSICINYGESLPNSLKQEPQFDPGVTILPQPLGRPGIRHDAWRSMENRDHSVAKFWRVADMRDLIKDLSYSS